MELTNEKTQESKGEELVQRENVKDSPFVIITTEDGSFGSMGKWRITEIRKTKNEVLQELTKITWDRIIQVVMLLTEVNKEQK